MSAAVMVPLRGPASARSARLVLVSFSRRHVGLSMKDEGRFVRTRDSTAPTLEVVDADKSDHGSTSKPSAAATTGMGAAAAGSKVVSAVAGTVAAGVTNAAAWIKRTSVPEPDFSVVSSGMGCMLHAKLPANSAVYSTVGSAIGMSTEVETHVTALGGPLVAAARSASGGDFFMTKFSTGDEPGDVLLAPKFLGDIAAIRMDGSADYYLARDALLAASPSLSLSPRVSQMGSDLGYFHMRARGRGTLAIYGYGSLFRLVLGPDEVYMANARHIVAWDAAMRPQPITKDSDNTKENPVVRIYKAAVRRVKLHIAREQDFFKFSGPGDIYLSTRIEPRFMSLASLRNVGARISSPAVVQSPASIKAALSAAPASQEETNAPPLAASVGTFTVGEPLQEPVKAPEVVAASPADSPTPTPLPTPPTPVTIVRAHISNEMKQKAEDEVEEAAHPLKRLSKSLGGQEEDKQEEQQEAQAASEAQVEETSKGKSLWNRAAQLVSKRKN